MDEADDTSTVRAGLNLEKVVELAPPWETQPLRSIEVPQQFAEDLIAIARRWDEGDTTEADDVSLLEVFIALLTGNMEERQVAELLEFDLEKDPGVIRDLLRICIRNGLRYAGIEREPVLRLSGFNRGVAPVDATQRNREAAQTDAAPVETSQAVAEPSRFNDGLSRMMSKTPGRNQ